MNDNNDANDGLPEVFRTVEIIRRLAHPIGEHIVSLIQPAVATLGPLQELLQSEAFRVQVHSVVSEIARPINQLAFALQPLAETLRTLEFQSRAYEVVETLARFVENAKRLPEDSRDAFAVMAEHGWYFDGEQMSLMEPMERADQFQTDSTAANDTMAGHFESRLDDIEAKLVARHPVRAHILKDALAAHRDGKYTLSIPVLLAQADGICQDAIGSQLYSNHPKTGIAPTIDAIPLDPYKSAVVSPLKLRSPLVANARERVQGDGKLNRHLVIHGESTDYPNKLNSLRTISLVWFVSWAFEFAKESEPEES